MTRELAYRIVEAWGDDHVIAKMMQVVEMRAGELGVLAGVACSGWPDFVAAVAVMFADETFDGENRRAMARELRGLNCTSFRNQIIVY